MRLPMRSARPIVCALGLTVLAACAQRYLEPKLHPADAAPTAVGDNDSLKVHMRSGELWVLGNWSLADSNRRVLGRGVLYDVWRKLLRTDSVSVLTDSVALFETNSQEAAYALGLQGVGAATIVGAFVSAACLMDPKSCFGSCPTFYVEGRDSARVRAEGFSASVAKVLEARDVDALGPHDTDERQLAIRMRNEAWETQMVRQVGIIAVPRKRGERVFASGDSAFYFAASLTPPGRCRDESGDCLRAVSFEDGNERFSPADSIDLAAREVIELTFRMPAANAGLVLTARNSLVTTFLFYQTLAYLGSRAGDALASMERGGRAPAEGNFGMARLLGGIEVQVRDSSGAWITVGAHQEAGPIASDTKVIPLPRLWPANDSVSVRLRMAKGNWRIDWVALAELGGLATTVRIAPKSIERAGVADARALATLQSGSRHLVMLPGDDYRVVFDLPLPAHSLELFLESEGYYYEWMRREWLAEESAAMAALVIHDPAEGLRQMARPYKSRESRMEQLFWASRFNPRSRDAKNH